MHVQAGWFRKYLFLWWPSQLSEIKPLLTQYVYLYVGFWLKRSKAVAKIVQDGQPRKIKAIA